MHRVLEKKRHHSRLSSKLKEQRLWSSSRHRKAAALADAKRPWLMRPGCGKILHKINQLKRKEAKPCTDKGTF